MFPKQAPPLWVDLRPHLPIHHVHIKDPAKPKNREAGLPLASSSELPGPWILLGDVPAINQPLGFRGETTGNFLAKQGSQGQPARFNGHICRRGVPGASSENLHAEGCMGSLLVGLGLCS